MESGKRFRSRIERVLIPVNSNALSTSLGNEYTNNRDGKDDRAFANCNLNSSKVIRDIVEYLTPSRTGRLGNIE